MLRVRAPLIPPIDCSAEGSLSAPAATISAIGSATVPQFNGSGNLSLSAPSVSSSGLSAVPQYSALGSLLSAPSRAAGNAVATVPVFIGNASLASSAAQAAISAAYAPPAFSAKGAFFVKPSNIKSEFSYIWDKPMSEPSVFNFNVYSNENFEISLAFPWILSQWPLPDGSYFDIDIRSKIDDVQSILSFASENSPRTTARDITIYFDRNRRIVILGLFAPQSLIANLSRDEKYLIDVRLTRPRGTSDPRVDVIGRGFISILKGVTRG